MAWLYRRKRGGRFIGPWYARAKVNGRDVRESLRTGSKVVARKRLAEFERRAEHVRYYGAERVTWKRAVVDWNAAIASPGDRARASLKSSVALRYKVSLRQVRPVLDALYQDEIALKTMAEIVKHRRAAGASNATIRRDLTAVSSVLDFCCAQGWRDDNPARNYNRKVIKEQRDPIVLPAAADIDGVVSVAPGNFARLIRLAQFTGMRQEEIGGLELPQLRAGAADLTHTKTSRPRSVPLDGRAEAVLAGVVRHLHSKAVFWHGDGARYRNISSRFAGLMRAAVRAGKVSRAFRFHDLRHWYAVDFLRPVEAGGRGGNVYDLKLILGHSTIRTTELYLDFLTPEEAERAKAGAQKGAQ